MNNMRPTYQQFSHKSVMRVGSMKKIAAGWDETVYRYTNFMRNHLKNKHDYNMDEVDLLEIESAILGLEVMPSMRL